MDPGAMEGKVSYLPGQLRGELHSLRVEAGSLPARATSWGQGLGRASPRR